MSDLLPDLTPLIDVIFMIIIFLILTTNVQHNVFDVDLPVDSENSTNVLHDIEVINVTIYADEMKWSIGDETFTSFERFKEALLHAHQTNPNRTVMIFSDKQVTIDKLFDLLTFMQAKGIPAADIVMDRLYEK